MLVADFTTAAMTQADRVEALRRELEAAGGHVPGAAGEIGADGVIEIDEGVWPRPRGRGRRG